MNCEDVNRGWRARDVLRTLGMYIGNKYEVLRTEYCIFVMGIFIIHDIQKKKENEESL